MESEEVDSPSPNQQNHEPAGRQVSQGNRPVTQQQSSLKRPSLWQVLIGSHWRAIKKQQGECGGEEGG